MVSEAGYHVVDLVSEPSEAVCGVLGEYGGCTGGAAVLGVLASGAGWHAEYGCCFPLRVCTHGGATGDLGDGMHVVVFADDRGKRGAAAHGAVIAVIVVGRLADYNTQLFF